MKKIAFLCMLCVELSACASLMQSNTDWIAIGPAFPAKKTPAEIEIFTDKKDITHPYGNLGLLRVKNLTPNRDSLKRGVQEARKIAASKGGDAIFIGQYNNAEDGIANPTVTLIVYVLKYGDNLTEGDYKAMEDFEIEGALNNSVSF
ncbi:MAG: hypothetical protein IKN49_04060 [Elusimicrobiaceae bacterium]|nr:hypothetical protein [Elusimicrobiaceae bacterium]